MSCSAASQWTYLTTLVLMKLVMGEKVRLSNRSDDVQEAVRPWNGLAKEFGWNSCALLILRPLLDHLPYDTNLKKNHQFLMKYFLNTKKILFFQTFKYCWSPKLYMSIRDFRWQLHGRCHHVHRFSGIAQWQKYVTKKNQGTYGQTVKVFGIGHFQSFSKVPSEKKSRNMEIIWNF